MCLFRLFFLFPLWYEKYKSKMSVTLEPVQTEIAEPIAEPLTEENTEEIAEVAKVIPEVEEVVPEVQEAVAEAVQPENVEGPRQHQTKKWRRQLQNQ